jgi:uncharacterized Zn-finger protein
MLPPSALPRTAKAACNGDKDSPHPKIYLALQEGRRVPCPYCGKQFEIKESA